MLGPAKEQRPARRTEAPVRNRALHDQLKMYAGQAAERLQAVLDAGSEIPFEVAEAPGARSVLYRYKPLSEEFVRERFGELRALEAFPATVSALARVEGTSAYLRVLGTSYVPAFEHDRAETALSAFLCRLWEESSTFELDDARFERAYRELESIVYEDTAVNTVVAPLVGVRLAAERWELGSGITLVRGDLFDAPPEAVWTAGRDDDEPNTLITLMVESTPSEPPPLTAARIGFRKVLTALRLLKAGAATLGATAWWRTDEGPWQPVPLGFAGRSRGGRYWLEGAERPELAELFELLRSRPAQGGALPWALARFELGCEHPVALEGLSDHLLALRAILGEGERSERAIGRRLAALCAEPADQRPVRDRVEQAFKLEQLVMRSNIDAAYMAAIGIEAPELVVRELEENLRALLRDMVCGHIDANVRAIADDLLPPEQDPRSRDIEAPPEPTFVVRRGREATTDTLLGIDDAPGLFTPTAPPPQEPVEEPPTESHEPATEEHAPVSGGDDWGLDDDAADYSAAV
jgi:hypothetical protein